MTGAQILEALRSVIKQDVSQADIGTPTELVAPEPDVIVVIATTDELSFLSDLVAPRKEVKTPHRRGRGFKEYQLTLKHKVALPGRPAKKRPIVRLVVLGAQGELRAATALMAVLDRLKTPPALIVSLGTAGALSSDVRLGDVIVSRHVDRYLEQARMEDVAASAEQPTSYYHVKCSGEVLDVAVAEQLVHLHTDSATAIKKFVGTWQSEGAEDAQRIMNTDPRLAAITAKLIDERPRLVCGPTACGPLLVDSKNFKTHLENHRNRHHLCVDMESGGVLAAAAAAENGAEAIVIRAACDFGDGRKKTVDQGRTIAGMPSDAYRRLAMRNAWRAFNMILRTEYLIRNAS